MYIYNSYMQAKATKMKKILGSLVLGLSLFGCKENPSEKKEINQKVEFNQDLADELKRMAEVDQIAVYIT